MSYSIEVAIVGDEGTVATWGVDNVSDAREAFDIVEAMLETQAQQTGIEPWRLDD